jgi:single-strand DNA-binding protein
MLKMTAVGNLARDIEVKEWKDSFVGNFTIGVSVGFGENKTTEWIQCTIWGKRAKSLEPYLKKGKKIVVVGNGSLKTYETKDGETRSNIALTVDMDGLSFASSRASESKQDNSTSKANEQQEPFVDDDIPF